MSCKITLNSYSESQMLRDSALMDPSVLLAVDDANLRLFERRGKRKFVRVVTVVAYMFFVSFAAIMLSLYYVFFWNGEQKALARMALRRHQQHLKCANMLAAMRQPAVSATDLSEVVVSSSTTTIDNDNYTTMFDLDYEIIKPRISEIDGNNNHDDSNNIYNLSKSNFIKKLMMSFDDISSSNDDQYPYDDNK